MIQCSVIKCVVLSNQSDAELNNHNLTHVLVGGCEIYTFPHWSSVSFFAWFYNAPSSEWRGAYTRNWIKIHQKKSGCSMQFSSGMWPKYNKKFITGVAATQRTQGSRTIGLCKLYDTCDMACGQKEQRKAKHLSVDPYTKEKEGEWSHTLYFCNLG